MRPCDAPDPSDYARWLRLRQGLDQEHLAAAAAVPVSVITSLEYREPSCPDDAAELAAVLRVAANELLEWSHGTPGRRRRR